MTNTDIKKYKLISEDYKIICGRKLYRIEALKDFNGVKTGELGGYIESEDNLSHEGNAWVANNAKVYSNAKIRDNAIVGGNAQIYGNTIVCGNVWVYDNATVCCNAQVSSRARIYGSARISDNACICGNARICGNATVDGDAKIYGSVKIRDNAWVRGNAEIGNNAMISDKKNWFTVGPIGSRDDFTTFFLGKDGNIYVSCGCFHGNIDKFEKAVEKTHAGTKYEKDYKFAIAFAKDKITTINIKRK